MFRGCLTKNFQLSFGLSYGWGMAKRHADDYLDAITEDPEVDEDLPVKLLEFCRKWHGMVRRIQVKYASPDRDDWKMVNGHFQVPYPSNPSVESMAAKAMELVRRHAEEQMFDVEGAVRYRAAFTVMVKNQERLKHCNLRASMSPSGIVSVEDDDDGAQQERETIMLFREVMMEMREEKRQLMDHTLNAQDKYADSVAKLGEEVQNIAGQVAAITGALAGMAEAATTTVREAGELYRASEAKSAELRRIELEAEQIRVEQEAKDRKVEGALELLKQAGPLILGKLLNTDPAVLMAMMMSAQGQDASAMMANMKALSGAQEGGDGGDGDDEDGNAPEESASKIAVSWVIPPKPRGFDPEGREITDLDARESLSLFFAQLSDDQERKTRGIVGEELYDFVRTAADRDVGMAETALRKLDDKIKGLPDKDKGRYAAALVNVLGSDLGMYFLGLIRMSSPDAEKGDDKPN